MVEFYVEPNTTTIPLGRQGENLARTIYFELSELISNYGEGTATLVYLRSKDSAPYVCDTTQSGNMLSWTPTDTDTAFAGGGRCELRWTVGETLAKSIVYNTSIAPSIMSAGQIPDPYLSWYDAMMNYIKNNYSESGAPQEVREAIFKLLSKAAYIETGLADELATVQAWASANYTIRNNLTNVITNNNTGIVVSGSSYTATLTGATGYVVGSVTVTMGGEDVTSTVYSDGVITIAEVTGDVVITASGVAAVVSLSAVYTQSGTVYDTDTLDSLKADLVVTATYSDSSTAVIPSTDYVLSGTLSIGTSTITVTYAGKTATFNVVVSEIYEYSMSNGLLVKVVGGTIVDTNSPQNIVLQSSNTNRRTFYVENGTKPVVSRDASYAETDYYPIPVPASATQVTVSITPATQFHGEAFWTYINGVYTRTYDPGWKEGSFTHTFEAGTYDFLTTVSKYNSSGSSYPTEPTELVVEFE